MAKTVKRRAKHTNPSIIMGIIHAKWCGHCKSTLPEWKIMAKMLKSYSKIKCVDIEENQINKKLPKINQQYLEEGETPISANGFPTIFRIEGGKVKYYDGERTAVKMFNWATKHENKHGGEGDVPPSHYSAKETPIVMGGKTIKRRKSVKRTSSSWLSFW